jgi:Fe-S cluster assembly ATP-binding protein
MIKLKNISVSVEGKKILSNINFDLKPGEIIALMGPNGSGKSTIALTLAGHPKYQITSGQIILDGKNITSFSPDKRANLGLFLSNQSPITIPGLNVTSFLWQIYKNFHNNQKMSLLEFRSWLESEAKQLEIKNELLNRSLNDGFSGGERKKMELLQMLVSNPKYLIIDEIDSGLDVDALKIISNKINQLAQKNKIGILIITHYNRFLKYLVPNRVLILEQGVIKSSGGVEFIDLIENNGFKK